MKILSMKAAMTRTILTLVMGLTILSLSRPSNAQVNGSFANVNATGTINAQGGFKIANAAPNNKIMCGNGSTYQPADTCGTAATLYYQTLQLGGVAFPQRAAVNFDSTYFSGADDSGNNRTNISLKNPLPIVATQAQNATQAQQFDHTPSTCTLPQVSSGVNAAGNSICVTPPTGTSGSLHTGLSRSFGTTYTNNYGHAITVSGAASTSGGGEAQTTCTVDGNVVWSSNSNATSSGGRAGFYCTVPNGSSYVVTTAFGGITGLAVWVETELN